MFFLQHIVKLSMIILKKFPSPWYSTSLYLDVQNLYLSDQPFSLTFHWIAQRFKNDRLNPGGNQGIINIPLQLLPWLSSIKIKFYKQLYAQYSIIVICFQNLGNTRYKDINWSKDIYWRTKSQYKNGNLNLKILKVKSKL